MLRIALLVTVVGACSPTARFHRTAAGPATPKADNCWLDVLSFVPEKSFQEVGTFDIVDGGIPIRSTDQVLSLIRPRACAEGADAVIPRKSGDRYVQAVALRWAAVGTTR